MLSVVPPFGGPSVSSPTIPFCFSGKFDDLRLILTDHPTPCLAGLVKNCLIASPTWRWASAGTPRWSQGPRDRLLERRDQARGPRKRPGCPETGPKISGKVTKNSDTTSVPPGLPQGDRRLGLLVSGPEAFRPYLGATRAPPTSPAPALQVITLHPATGIQNVGLPLGLLR